MPEISDLDAGLRALEPDEARSLLRECVTVVAPGETLVVRVSDWWTPKHTDEFMRYFDAQGFPFRMVLVPAEEFAVVRAGQASDLSELTWPEKRDIARRTGMI